MGGSAASNVRIALRFYTGLQVVQENLRSSYCFSQLFLPISTSVAKFHDLQSPPNPICFNAGYWMVLPLQRFRRGLVYYRCMSTLLSVGVGAVSYISLSLFVGATSGNDILRLWVTWFCWWPSLALLVRMTWMRSTLRNLCCDGSFVRALWPCVGFYPGTATRFSDWFSCPESIGLRESNPWLVVWSACLLTPYELAFCTRRSILVIERLRFTYFCLIAHANVEMTWNLTSERAFWTWSPTTHVGPYVSCRLRILALFFKIR